MNLARRTSAAIALLAVAATAQIPADAHVVVSRFPTAPRTRLHAVDVQTGAVSALPGFASDALPPLAIAFDPFDRHLVLALDAGGVSRVVRLVPLGSVLVELPLWSGQGRVTQLGIASEDLLIAVDDPNGGLFRMPRRGGVPVLVRSQPNLTALHVYAPLAQSAVIAWTGRPGSATTDSGVELIDLATGAGHLSATTFPNPTGRETTGVVDLPTGLVRHLLSFDDGTFTMVAFGVGMTPVVATPQPPAGAAAAMKPFSFGVSGTVVGGASHPFVAEIDAFSGAFTIRSSALPGDAVDFAEALPSGPSMLPMASACGLVGLAHGVSGMPQIGTTMVLEGRGGPPGQLAILVAGFDDYVFGLLPWPLPGGCSLHVNPDAAVWLTWDAASVARQSIAIPPNPAFAGLHLFTQFLHVGATISTSEAMALHVGM